MEESQESMFAEWEIHKERLKKEYPHLTDEDLHYEKGKEADTLLRISKKLNKTEKDIRYFLSVLG